MHLHVWVSIHILGRQITLYALRHLLSSAWLLTLGILPFDYVFVNSYFAAIRLPFLFLLF
jgi:hypothetical protein